MRVSTLFRQPTGSHTPHTQRFCASVHVSISHTKKLPPLMFQFFLYSTSVFVCRCHVDRIDFFEFRKKSFFLGFFLNFQLLRGRMKFDTHTHNMTGSRRSNASTQRTHAWVMDECAPG